MLYWRKPLIIDSIPTKKKDRHSRLSSLSEHNPGQVGMPLLQSDRFHRSLFFWLVN